MTTLKPKSLQVLWFPFPQLWEWLNTRSTRCWRKFSYLKMKRREGNNRKPTKGEPGSDCLICWPSVQHGVEHSNSTSSLWCGGDFKKNHPVIHSQAATKTSSEAHFISSRSLFLSLSHWGIFTVMRTGLVKCFFTLTEMNRCSAQLHRERVYFLTPTC